MNANQYDIRAIEQFIFGEVRCIDERRWSDWLSLFAEDGEYWIPLSLDDEQPGLGLSILYEDRAKLELRCARYLHPMIHSQNPPSRTSHLVSNVMVDRLDPGSQECLVTAQFSMRESRPNMTVDWAGTFHYRLLDDGNAWKIKRKKVLLVDAESQLETIHIPF